jgi:hypothetical protein
MPFYRTASTSALLNRALPTLTNRAFAAPVRAALVASFQSRQSFGQRQKFAVTPTETGGHDVTLSDNETAKLTVDETGALTITVENKPPVVDDASADAVPTDMPAVAVVESAYRSTGRSGSHGQRSKMSWTDEPDGTIVFVPGEDEMLVVTGDSIRASVIAEPTA